MAVILSCWATKGLVMFLLGFVSYSAWTEAKCGGRTILTDLNGSVHDGSGKYPENTQCEWLIRAPHSNMTITLIFLEYATECTYDYLFIHDGPSYSSSLLASFSGANVPGEVVAHSGQMLLNLYSDRDYSLDGFTAHYTVENCTKGCSGHGMCHNGYCACDRYWRGRACDLKWCPELCQQGSGHGVCDPTNEHCACSDGYAGESCSLSILSDEGANSWYKMVTYSPVFTPRMGHDGVYFKNTDTFYVFGGFDLNFAVDDLLEFNMTYGQWKKISTAQPKPAGRYSHTVSLYKDCLLVFGGHLTNRKLSNELWMFNITFHQWSQLAVGDPNVPPPVAEHTANVVNDKLIIYGGRTDNTSFSSAMYMYTLSGATGWQQVKYKSGKELGHRVVGHATVYHPDTNSLIVFGGFSPNNPRTSRRMNKIHVFHLDEFVWTEWQTDGDANVPKPRAFLTATLVRDYIVVFGGNRHEHYKDETCYDNDFHFYHLKCRKWVPMSVFSTLSPTSTPPSQQPRGRFSHIALLRDSILVIIGGYAGVPLGDTHAYKLPVSVAIVNQSGTAVDGSHCTSISTEAGCQPDPACGWCNGLLKCFAIQNVSHCSTGWRTNSCPGQCGVLMQCTSCLAWGTRHVPKCGWCVQDSRCYLVGSPRGACQKANSGNAEQLKGWWGTSGTFLTSLVSQCRSQDYTPGLKEVSYKLPVDLSHPDFVTIASDSTAKMVYNGRRYSLTSYTIKNLTGFVYPFKHRSPPWKIYSLRLAVAPVKISSGKLFLSTDSTMSTEEKVAECKSNSKVTGCTNYALRTPGNKALFINPTENKKYYIRIETKQDIMEDTTSSASFKVTWNGAGSGVFANLPFYGRRLEPFSSKGTGCSSLANCMACMTDASCGWCDLSNQCLSRAASPACQDGSGHQKHLILNATECSRCEDHVECNTCLQDGLCEWKPGDLRCYRRKRIGGVFTDIKQCSLPCHSRTSCSQCIADIIGCTWCDATSECFVFGSYITRYPHGECSHWIDSNTNSKCRNCSIHTSCSTCLAGMKCGWCANTNNPLLGRCFSGDCGGPHQRQCSSSSINVTGSTIWSCARCPDVDECRLGLDTCHHNATCHNVYGSYSCLCNQGYTGDGKITCNRTCYPSCVHGSCEADYKCRCDLGWLGANCSIDCGCYGHSSCNQGIGICDKCQDYTHGNHCQLCVPGSYGNATTSRGCRPCNCNGHGDTSKGVCDRVTGRCFCKDNTLGEHCDQCMAGLKGDPRNGGRCYYECSGRSILTNVTQGDISTSVGDGVKDRSRASCVWVISTSTNTSHSVVYGAPATPSQTAIALTFINMSVDCLTDHVVVYDGLPPFILGSARPYPPKFYKLGSFCGPSQSKRSIVATLGNMVVVFKGNIAQEARSAGFSAIFTVQRCTSHCHGNRQCLMTSQGETCACRQGWTGADCDIRMCPNNCSVATGRGSCHTSTGRCMCTAGHVGIDCSIVVSAGKGAWEILSETTFPNSSTSPLARMAHSMVTRSQSLWVYGGYSMAYGIVDDVWRYDVSRKTWSRVVTNQIAATMPTARYFHCAVLHQDTMVVFGGIAKQGTVNDVWYFDFSPPAWRRKTPSNQGPSVAGHTCTLINDVITMVGGYDPISGFNDRVYQYHVILEKWTVMDPLGTQPAGLYGHSAVYHASTETVLVFGGYRFKSHTVQPSDELYALHLPSRRWSILQAQPSNQPSPKFFHSATILGEFMVVYGGRGRTSEQNFSDELMVYKVSCNYWHSMRAPASDIVGVSPGRRLAAAAIVYLGKMYIFGGFDGQTKSSLHRLTLPSDLCHVIQKKTECLSAPGCSWCEVHNITLTLNDSSIANGTSACYSITSSIPTLCHTIPNVTHVVFHNGSQCDVTAAKRRDCSSYYSCAACLARYPGSPGVDNRCAWCSNCPGGSKCVSYPSPQDAITDAGSCRESTNQCEAVSCAGCTGKCNGCTPRRCFWTPQLNWLSESTQQLVAEGVPFPWNCFLNSPPNTYPTMTIRVTSSSSCPRSCSVYNDCRLCLRASGSEAGWKECVWSDTLGKCYSPSTLPMMGVVGVSGRIVRGSPQFCMPPCIQARHCALCLRGYNCVWCATQGSKGVGICMEGGLKGPLYGTCQGNTIDVGHLNVSSSITTHISTQISPVWASVLCPLENECLNNRHNCTSLQNCVDTPESFTCVCKPGFEQRGRDKCIPVCESGCENGKCVAPNKCECHFGWTSRNCTMKCQCNGHGRCANETHRDICSECRNHTMGTSCEYCEPLYVGDARDNGTCQTCYNVCNHSAHVCMAMADLLNAINKSYSLDSKQVVDWLPHGPRAIVQDGECICGNFSRDVKCKHCLKGYFFLNGYCTPCRCNGHGDDCKEITGKCTCQNHTVEDCNHGAKGCYDLQCSKCEDNYMGDPTDSRQCYAKISHMQEFMISSTTGKDINDKNVDPLFMGRSVPYVVFPKYTNVDIRTTIDVFRGGIDVFISTDDQAFSVSMNKTTGVHTVVINPSQSRKRRDVSEQEIEGVRHVYAGSNKLNTFVTFQSSQYSVRVSSVEKRLVITFPYDNHALRSTRFYLIFLGVGNTESSDTTGIVYFRQDLSQIDLFVFFSVFFSVFFLVLSICVVTWKLKQFHDRRRIAQVQERELETMASRPFAPYSFLVDTTSSPPRSCWKVKRESSRNHLHGQATRKAQIYMREIGERPVIAPAAHEATADLKASVVTVMFQLPGNECSDFQLSFGSTLTATSNQHPLGVLFGHQLLNGQKLSTRHTVTMTS